MGASYPADEITENWKKITFNQFHDLAAGSGIAVIYRDAQKDFTQVFDTDKLMSRAAMNHVACQHRHMPRRHDRQRPRSRHESVCMAAQRNRRR